MSTIQSARRHLWFERNGSCFALPMDYLREVLAAPPLRPLPGVEPALVGLMHLRDRVLPVLDPWSLASAAPGRPSRQPLVLVVDVAGHPLFGLLAEQVGKVIELSTPQRLARPARLPTAFAGQGQQEELGALLVLNVPALAAAFELVQPHRFTPR